MAKWLVVKVMHDEDLESQYKLNQIAGVDCMELTPEHPAFRQVVDSFDEDINAVVEGDQK